MTLVLRSDRTMAPRGVLLLNGCAVASVHEPHDFDHRGYYGIEIYLGSEEGQRQQRILYARSALERKKWLAALQASSCKPPLEDVYVMGEELGKGQFSTVVQATHRVSNEAVAVKVIDKRKLGQNEKELLRTEIAILKLVQHPNILQLKVRIQCLVFVQRPEINYIQGCV